MFFSLTFAFQTASSLHVWISVITQDAAAADSPNSTALISLSLWVLYLLLPLLIIDVLKIFLDFRCSLFFFISSLFIALRNFLFFDFPLYSFSLSRCFKIITVLCRQTLNLNFFVNFSKFDPFIIFSKNCSHNFYFRFSILFQIQFLFKIKNFNLIF